MKNESIVKELMSTIPQVGKVEFIAVRPERKVSPKAVDKVKVTVENGLDEDHFKSQRSKKRQVTLIQDEHLEATGKILGTGKIDPLLTRRNIVVSGINLLSLKGMRFKIGTAVLEGTGECHPCSRMEEHFGPGGYNAMRGHGGLTAMVIEDGEVAVGDRVKFLGEAG